MKLRVYGGVPKRQDDLSMRRYGKPFLQGGAGGLA